MGRWTFSALTAALGIAVGMLLPAPAYADASVGADTHTLYDDCHDYPVEVTGSMPGAYEWDYEITLYGPSGEVSSFDYAYGSGDSVNETTEFFVCADEGVGVYTIAGTLTWTDSDYNTIAQDDLSSEMKMVRQRTTSSLRVSDRTPAYNSVVRMSLRSRQETPSGWGNNAYEYVALEKKCGGEWSRVRGSRKLTNAYGRARYRYRWDLLRTCRVRSVTLSTVNSATSKSSPVIIDPH